MKKIAILSLLCVAATATYAQEKRVETRTEVDNIGVEYKTKYVSAPNSNLYIQGSFGGTMLFGEDDSKLSFGERLRPSFSIVFGKKITPLLGARIGLEGNSLRGWNGNNGGSYPNHQSDPRKDYLDSKGVDTSNGYEQDYRYFSVNADVMLDLLNAFEGKKRNDRKWELDAYGGIGILTTLERKGVDNKTSFAGRVGLATTYNVTDRIGINLDLGTAITGAEFDGHVGKGETFDFVNTVKVGVKWRFGKQGFKTVYSISSEQYAALSNYMSTVSTEQMEKGEPEEKVVVIAAKDKLLIPYVVFHEGKATFNEELQMVNISNAAKIINENPDCTMEVIGNTNSTTKEIAEQRANAVKEILVKRYSIAPERIVVKAEDMNEDNQTVHFITK